MDCVLILAQFCISHFTFRDIIYTFGDMHIVRAAVLDGFEELVSQLGLDAVGLLRRVGLPANVLHPESADNYLPVAGLESLYTLAEHESGQYNLAARLASTQDITSSLGVLGLIMQQCKTVGDALLELQNLLSFQIKGAYIHIDVSGVQPGQPVRPSASHTASFEFVLQESTKLPSSRHTVEFALASAVVVFRSLCGEAWRPKYIQVMHGDSRHSQRLQRYLYADTYFNQERNAIVCAASDLALPIKSANPQLNRILHDYLTNIEDDLSADPSLQVEKLIRQALNSGSCDVNKVASLMGVHRRTLHRLLKKQSVSYTMLLQKVRSELAVKMLLETNTNITLIADILCYADLSAFSRAFKSWFDCTPQQYRKSAGHAS